MKRICTGVIAFLMMWTMCTGCGRSSGDTDAHEKAVQTYRTLKVMCGVGADEPLLSAGVLQAGDSISQWVAFLAAKEGTNEDPARFLQDMEEWVTSQYTLQGGLDSIKATEWQRTALVVLALGGNPTHFGSYQGKPIDLVADGSYNWHMTDDLAGQGSNALIFALTMLDAGDYEVPADAVYSTDAILQKLISYQNEETGGIGLAANGDSDVDLTAMAVAALAGYRGREEVDAFIEKALGYLSREQLQDGSFSNGEEASSESCSQVIIALAALGIDPAADERFIKDGSVLDGLASFEAEDGGFKHTANQTTSDGMATYQAGMAYTALDLMNHGKSLYKIVD